MSSDQKKVLDHLWKPSRCPTDAEILAMQTLHEATLQDLLRASNEAMHHILHERNVVKSEL